MSDNILDLGKIYNTLASEYQALPTLHTGHFDNLKLEGRLQDGLKVRVWLSRMTVEDGMPYDNQVTIECFTLGYWREYDKFRPLDEHLKV